MKNLAYVKFEHGEAVTTRINKPVVKITKTAPKQTVRDEQYVVRIAVDNTGKVPVEKVRVAENVPASAEVQPITAGGVRMAQPQGQQWVWEIAKLMPGERQVHRIPHHRPRRRKTCSRSPISRPTRGFRTRPNQRRRCWCRACRSN